MDCLVVEVDVVTLSKSLIVAFLISSKTTGTLLLHTIRRLAIPAIKTKPADVPLVPITADFRVPMCKIIGSRAYSPVVKRHPKWGIHSLTELALAKFRPPPPLTSRTSQQRLHPGPRNRS